MTESDYAQALLARQLTFEWAPTHMAADDPAKGLGKAAPEALLWFRVQTHKVVSLFGRDVIQAL